ncbi:MAG: metallophosphoesterase [Elusimicrobia bacterium]|nr:metallophosphoesterase [Elusimicrobiota bacterium]
MDRTLPFEESPGPFRRLLDPKFLIDSFRGYTLPFTELDSVDELERLSAPLRTTRQLEMLASAPRMTGDEFEFAVLGDAEPGRFWFSRMLFNIPGVFERQVRMLQEHPIDFSMQLGDMVSRGIEQNYLRFFRQLSRAGLRKPYLTVIGNHDRHRPHGVTHSQVYRSCFGRNNYFFDHGGVRFVTVDSSASRVTAPQIKWLNLVLRTDLRKIVFTHIPPATLRCWTDFAGRRGIGGFKSGAAAFTETMAKHKVDRVFLGHIHGFGVQDCGGVRYVLSGGGGSPLFPSGVPDKLHHYIVVRVAPNAIRETVHSLDGGKFVVPAGKVLISR